MQLRFLLFILIIPVTCFGGLGFYERLPNEPLVNAQKDKVVHIIMAGKPFLPVETKFITEEILSQLKLDLNEASTSEDFATFLSYKAAKDCLDNKTEYCFIPQASFSGTAFFLGDGKTLYTAFHNVMDSFEGYFQEEFYNPLARFDLTKLIEVDIMASGSISEISLRDHSQFMDWYVKARTRNIPVILRDHSGKIIFGLDDRDRTLVADFHLEASLMFLGYFQDVRPAWDFTRIELAREVGEPLEVVRNKERGDFCSPLGIPIQVDRSGHSKPGATGEAFYFTKGESLSAQQAFDRSIGSEHFLRSEGDLERLELKIGFCSGDGAPRMSGGPVFNNEGKVRFILTDFAPKEPTPITEDNVFVRGPLMSNVLSYFEDLVSFVKERQNTTEN